MHLINVIANKTSSKYSGKIEVYVDGAIDASKLCLTLRRKGFNYNGRSKHYYNFYSSDESGKEIALDHLKAITESCSRYTIRRMDLTEIVTDAKTI